MIHNKDIAMKLTKLLLLLMSAFILIYQSSAFAANQPKNTKANFTDGKLHIYFCGTGIPDPDNQWLRHPSCLAVVNDNTLFLIDSGAGASLRLSEIGLPINKVNVQNMLLGFLIN